MALIESEGKLTAAGTRYRCDDCGAVFAVAGPEEFYRPVPASRFHVKCPDCGFGCLAVNVRIRIGGFNWFGSFWKRV